MSEEAKAVQEIAKAFQEGAKAATEYRSGIERIAAFFGRIIGPPAIELSDLFTDSLTARKYTNAIKLEKRYYELALEAGISSPRPLPLSTGLPLLEAAILEENPDVAEMFANLLLTYTRGSDDDGELPKRYVDTIRAMSPFEASILKQIASAPPGSKGEAGYIYTAGLAIGHFLPAPSARDPLPDAPPKSVALALDGLQQSGCIRAITTMDGGVNLGQVSLTVYGRSFMEACGVLQPLDDKEAAQLIRGLG